jgi:hypothetical protein
MIPIQLAGLALASKTLLSKFGNNPGATPFTFFPKLSQKNTVSGTTRRTKPLFKLRPSTNNKASGLNGNPLETIFKGFSSAFARITKKSSSAEYSSIVKGFIPQGSLLLKPKYPMNSPAILLRDIDGDKNKELIASYRSPNGIRTIILKKQNDSWYKLSEISSPEYNAINFREVANISGNDNRQLLLGFVNNEKVGELYGYSLDGSRASEMFTHKYNNLDVIKNPRSNANLAIWEKEDAGTYRIGLYKWNGLELDNEEANSNYYYSHVAPYFAQKIKQSPYSAKSWYNFADALAKSKMYRDAEEAINIGMSLDKNLTLKDRFSALKDDLSEK